MEKRAVVAIHGVGLPRLGSVLREVQSGFSEETGPGHQEDYVIDGVTFPRVKFKDGPISEIIEVNWADVQRASQNSVGLLRHFIYIVNSLLHLGCDNFHDGGEVPKFCNVYRVLFEGVLVWCLYPSILILMLLSFETSLQKTIASLVVIVSVSILAAYLSKYSRYFLIGFAWVVVMILMTLALQFKFVEPEVLAEITTYIYAYGQLIVVLTLIVAALSVFLIGIKNYSKDYVLLRLSFLYLPILSMSAIGAIIWSLSLLTAKSISGSSQGYTEWKKIFLESLKYDLRTMEYVFGAAVFVIGILAIIGVIVYLFNASEKYERANRNRSGVLAQDWMSLMLHVMPVILTGVGIYYIVSVLGFLVFEGTNNANTNILEIYSWSAMRAIPFIPFLIGPFAILFDVLGDVLFYQLPVASDHSTNLETRKRLRNAIEAACRSHDTVVVLSHSQGSVIALDVIGGNPDLNARLITAGSPIESLHNRFLSSSAESRTNNFKVPKSWLNLYRLDDYIGGPIKNPNT